MAGINPDDWDLDDPVERAAYLAALDDCGGDCHYYLPGHQVHFIQARKSWSEPQQQVVVVGVDGHRARLLFGGGTTETVWHHRPVFERVRVGQVAFRRAYGLLSVSCVDGSGGLLCVRQEAS